MMECKIVFRIVCLKSNDTQSACLVIRLKWMELAEQKQEK